MMKISASEQVAGWLCGLPPEARRRIRMALRHLPGGRADIKALQGPLEGFCRLRVGGRRIIYRQISAKQILLEYANTRDVIYELFEQILRERHGK
jgi:mRNA-degrading endonuclease RelE of RelBE toxin-antitoxin system